MKVITVCVRERTSHACWFADLVRAALGVSLNNGGRKFKTGPHFLVWFDRKNQPKSWSECCQVDYNVRPEGGFLSVYIAVV